MRTYNFLADTSSPYVLRHAGVLGLSSCIKAFPYDVPDWMPQMLVEIGEHLHDPNPIQVYELNSARQIAQVLTNLQTSCHKSSVALWKQHANLLLQSFRSVSSDLHQCEKLALIMIHY